MTAGTDWTQASLLNELITAIRNRTYLLTGSYGSIATLSAGDDIQSATWIRSLQSWVESNYLYFSQPYATDPDKPPYTDHAAPRYDSTDMGSTSTAAQQFATDAGLNVSGTPSSWWTRKAPGTDTYGAMTAGDYIGPWIWKELAQALRAMSIVRDATVSFVDVSRTWLEFNPEDSYWNTWVVGYRSNDPALWMEWGYQIPYEPSAAEALIVRDNNVTNYLSYARRFNDFMAGAGYPSLPYAGAPMSDGVYMYSALSVLHNKTGQSIWMTGVITGYTASLGNCYKAVSYTAAKLWPGTATRKMFIRAINTYNINYVAMEIVPTNIVSGNQHTTFGGSSSYFRPPPSGRGGGNCPISSLQYGWNAIYSQSLSCSSGGTITRNITDSFSSGFSDYDTSCPITIYNGAEGHCYMKGWQSQEAESYIVIPDY